MLFIFYSFKKKLKEGKGWREQENEWEQKRNIVVERKKRKQRSGRKTGKLSKKKNRRKSSKEINRQERRTWKKTSDWCSWLFDWCL